MYLVLYVVRHKWLLLVIKTNYLHEGADKPPFVWINEGIRQLSVFLILQNQQVYTVNMFWHALAGTPSTRSSPNGI